MRLSLQFTVGCLACSFILGQGHQTIPSSRQVDGLFGRGVEVAGDTLVVASNELTGIPLEEGRLSIYKRDPSGTWVLRQVFGRNPHFASSHGSSLRFANDATIVGDSMIVESYRGYHCWELQRDIDGFWQPHEEIPLPDYGINFSGITSTAYDGTTLMMGFDQAGNAASQPDPNILFGRATPFL